MVTVVTAHGRAAAAHVRRRVVGVLREDGARAEDERQDERAREYKLLHSFSGSPLKESDRSCGVVSVRLAVSERPRAATPFSTLDRRRSQRPCQRARRDRRSVFASFCSRRTRRTRAPLWRLCAPLQNRHTFDCGIRIADCGLKRGCGLKTAWLSCSFNPKSAFRNRLQTGGTATTAMRRRSAEAIISSRSNRRVLPAVRQRQVAPASAIASTVGTPTTGTSKRMS